MHDMDPDIFCLGGSRIPIKLKWILSTELETMWIVMEAYVSKLKIKLTSPNLVPIAHKMVRCDETFEDDNPVRILCSLNEKVCQGRDRHVRFICTVQ